MISTSTFAFALAFVVCVFGAVGWITYARLMLVMESQRATTQSALRSLAAKQLEHQKAISECQRAAPTSLAAEVADLAGAVARLRTTHQKFAGRFDQYVGQQLPASAAGADRSYAGANQLDPELEAELALQRAPSAGPR